MHDDGARSRAAEVDRPRGRGASPGRPCPSQVDVARFAEACYREASAHQAWTAELLAAACATTVGMSVALGVARHAPSGPHWIALGARGPDEATALRAIASGLEAQRARLAQGARRGGHTQVHDPCVATHSLARQRVLVRVEGSAAEELTFHLALILPDAATARARDRALLSRCGVHLRSALRLRLGVQQPVARIDAEGTLVPLSEGAGPAAGLHRRVQRGLLDGTYCLASQHDGPRRAYLVLETAACDRVRLALSATERRAVQRVLTGLSGKVIAHELGLSEGRVSDALRSASTKLGTASRAALIRVLRALDPEPAEAPADVALSRAERAVLALLRRGHSNAEIARMRQRSPRTVANQVARLLRKLGVGGRRALLGDAPACVNETRS